jgi:hypothetical protein
LPARSRLFTGVVPVHGQRQQFDPVTEQGPESAGRRVIGHRGDQHHRTAAAGGQARGQGRAAGPEDLGRFVDDRYRGLG